MVAFAADYHIAVIGCSGGDQFQQCNSTIYLYHILMKGISREKALETCLVIATGFILLFYLVHLKIFLFLAFVVGLIGSFIKPLARLIAWLWLKLGDGMGYVMSKLILSLVFFLFLLPLALIYRMVNKDPLGLKRDKNTYWKNRDYRYLPKDLENTW